MTPRRKWTLTRNESDRGIAIITAIWMTMIGVMLVTTIASMIQSNVGVGWAIAADAKARAAATAGVHKAIAELIHDRPTVTKLDSGIVITEIRNYARVGFTSLITDSSFEQWGGGTDAFWSEVGTAGSINSYATTVRGGTKSCQFVSPTTLFSARGVVCETVNVTAGTTYNYGCYAYRGENSANPGQTDILIKIDFFDNTQLAAIGTDQISTSFTTALEWVRYEDQFVAPVGATKAILYIQVKETVNNDYDVYVDDAFINTERPGDPSRCVEFIEIQNTDDLSHNLVSEDWWISTGTDQPGTPAGSRRRIFPLALVSNGTDSSGSDSSLASGEVGVIVAGQDADLDQIADLSGKSVGDIKWFGLRSASGAAWDNQLGRGGASHLGDLYETVVLGYGVGAGAPAEPAISWVGVPCTPSVTSSGETSWQKGVITVMDDTTAPFSIRPDEMWELGNPPNPGVGLTLTGRAGYDGPSFTHTDTWYALGFDSFVLLDNRTFDIYYRVRVFDEGGKVNLNAARLSGSASYESNIVKYLFHQARVPAAFTNGTRADYYDSMYSSLMWHTNVSAGSVTLLDPTSPYLLRDTVSNAGAGLRMQAHYVPSLTIYGFREAGVFPININTAETPAIRAAMRWAIAHTTRESGFASASGGLTPQQGLAAAQAYADSLAELCYQYMTDNDHDSQIPYSEGVDTGYMSLTEIRTRTRKIDGSAVFGNTENNALSWAEGNGRLARAFNVASTNYFTIYAMGFAFSKGANVATDTPVAQNRVVVVVRRYVDANKADIIYWREIFESADPNKVWHVFPIGSWRYPKYRYDPDQEGDGT
jgi:hypothetical protein